MNWPVRPEVEDAFAAALELPDGERQDFLRRTYPESRPPGRNPL